MSNLLLVDDDAAIRESLGEYLASQGHALCTAETIEEAVALTETVRPDAVVSDLMLKAGTGLELKQELSRRMAGKEPAFILMSGQATLDYALQALHTGVDSFLMKPLNLSELSLAIDTSIKRKHLALPSLKIKFELAEQFYHDLSLPLNLLIPRLCMLLEGRHGALSMYQNRNISGQFEYLRRALWLMKGFYPRMLEGAAENPSRREFDAGVALRGLLLKVEDELLQRRVSARLPEMKGMGRARVVPETAEAFMEIVLLRALAVSEPGAALDLEWAESSQRLIFTLRLRYPNVAGPSSPIAQLIPMVPFSQACLEQAGLDFESQGPAGPWVLTFQAA